MKHLNKILITIINFLLLSLVTLIIKNQDQKDKVSQENFITPLSQEVLDNQDIISANREEKLRKINTTPREIRTTKTTTQTTTTTTTPSRTTRTS